jgi:hypothetical protein
MGFLLNVQVDRYWVKSNSVNVIGNPCIYGRIPIFTVRLSTTDDGSINE